MRKRKYYADNLEFERNRNRQRDRFEYMKKYHSSYIPKYDVAEYQKRWVIDNREKYNDIQRICQGRRRSKESKLPNTLNLEQWAMIKNDFNNSCAYCGMTEDKHLLEFNERLHQEHFIPLSQGGEYTHNNIIPACRSCNSSKSNKDFFEWYPNYKHYNKEREQFILECLGYEEQSNTQQLSIL